MELLNSSYQKEMPTDVESKTPPKVPAPTFNPIYLECGRMPRSEWKPLNSALTSSTALKGTITHLPALVRSFKLTSYCFWHVQQMKGRRSILQTTSAHHWIPSRQLSNISHSNDQQSRNSRHNIFLSCSGSTQSYASSRCHDTRQTIIPQKDPKRRSWSTWTIRRWGRSTMERYIIQHIVKQLCDGNQRNYTVL